MTEIKTCEDCTFYDFTEDDCPFQECPYDWQDFNDGEENYGFVEWKEGKLRRR